MSGQTAAMVGGAEAGRVAARLWLRSARLAAGRCGPVGAWPALRGLRALARTARQGGIPRFARIKGAYAWDLYLPPFPSPAFDRFIDGELEWLRCGRRPRPHTAIFAITRRCGLRCEHCFEWQALNRPEPLDGEALRRTLLALLQAGVTQLFFSGGEPLARLDELLDLVRLAGPAAHCWVITAGQGLTATTAGRLAEGGLDGVVVSLDHWSAAEHDAFRGRRGTFARAVEGARQARAAGLALALGLCPTRAFVTAANLEAYRRLAVELEAQFIQIMEPRAEGHYAGQDVALSGAQLALLEEFHQRLCCGREANPIVSYPALMARREGCQGGGERYLYVDTEGLAHACPFCKASAGCLATEPVGEVLERLRVRGCPAASCCQPTRVAEPAIAPPRAAVRTA